MSPILNIIAIVELLLWFLSFGLYDGLLLPRLRKADALRELKALEEGLAEAKSPEEVFAICKHQPPLSLQFQKSEKVLWVIPDCRYLKVKKHVNISGPSVYGLEMRLEYGIGHVGASLNEYKSLERGRCGDSCLDH